MSDPVPNVTPLADTRWTILRWRITVWLLWRALGIAPDGSAAVSLEDHLLDWSGMCGVNWRKRFPYPEAGTDD